MEFGGVTGLPRKGGTYGIKEPQNKGTPWSLWGCRAPRIKWSRGDGWGVSQNP